MQYYLEDQTDDIAHLIQNLLQSVRQNNGDSLDSRPLINSVTLHVDNIVYETKGTFDTTNNISSDMRADCEDVLDLLEDSRDKLLDMADNISNDRAFKQETVNTFYEIVKVNFRFHGSTQKNCYPLLDRFLYRKNFRTYCIANKL